MIAVKGMYRGGNTVEIDNSEIAVSEPCEVVVTFLQDAKSSEELRLEEEIDLKEGLEGLKILEKYHKTLRADFDCKKELSECGMNGMHPMTKPRLFV